MNCSYPLKLIVRLLTFRFGTGLSLYYGENLQTQEVYKTYKTKAKASYVTEGPTRLTRRAADHRVGGSGGFLFGRLGGLAPKLRGRGCEMTLHDRTHGRES